MKLEIKRVTDEDYGNKTEWIIRTSNFGAANEIIVDTMAEVLAEVKNLLVNGVA